MASEKVTAMIEEIKAMSVLELSELVHEIEDVFGVSAAAAVAAAPVAGAAELGSEMADQPRSMSPPSGSPDVVMISSPLVRMTFISGVSYCFLSIFSYLH